jgi:hypothetical protein
MARSPHGLHVLARGSGIRRDGRHRSGRGLDSNGVAVLADAKADGLDPNVINIMAMDYGPNADGAAQMGVDAISAALNTIKQISFAGLTSKVGITPMIGVNDDSAEVFSLSDAQALTVLADGNAQIARLAMWSMARDNGSGAGELRILLDFQAELTPTGGRHDPILFARERWLHAESPYCHLPPLQSPYLDRFPRFPRTNLASGGHNCASLSSFRGCLSRSRSAILQSVMYPSPGGLND